MIVKNLLSVNNNIYKIILSDDTFGEISISVLNDNIVSIGTNNLYAYFKSNGKIHSIRTLGVDTINEMRVFDTKNNINSRGFIMEDDTNYTSDIQSLVNTDDIMNYKFSTEDKFNLYIKYPSINLIEDYEFPLDEVVEKAKKILQG